MYACKLTESNGHGDSCICHCPVFVVESFCSRTSNRLTGIHCVENPIGFSVSTVVSHSSSVGVPFFMVDQWPVVELSHALAVVANDQPQVKLPVTHRIDGNLQVRLLLLLEIVKYLWSLLLNIQWIDLDLSSFRRLLVLIKRHCRSPRTQGATGLIIAYCSPWVNLFGSLNNLNKFLYGMGLWTKFASKANFRCGDSACPNTIVDHRLWSMWKAK